MKLAWSNNRKARRGRHIVDNRDGTYSFISKKFGKKRQRWIKRNCEC